ncbi:hypothetical protein [Thermococcus sp.]|uniref:hypothetical protein n=1 Tax=Thermococcus sp. TaxID=35749 RepID=UPI002625AB85|nr:hypothetical protein [Thermococcus sp.]
MDDITKEELLRGVPMFLLLFMTLTFLWGAADGRIPAVWVPVTSLLITITVVPLRIWYRHRRGW